MNETRRARRATIRLSIAILALVLTAMPALAENEGGTGAAEPVSTLTAFVRPITDWLASAFDLDQAAGEGTGKSAGNGTGKSAGNGTGKSAGNGTGKSAGNGTGLD